VCSALTVRARQPVAHVSGPRLRDAPRGFTSRHLSPFAHTANCRVSPYSRCSQLGTPTYEWPVGNPSHAESGTDENSLPRTRCGVAAHDANIRAFVGQESPISCHRDQRSRPHKRRPSGKPVAHVSSRHSMSGMPRGFTSRHLSPFAHTANCRVSPYSRCSQLGTPTYEVPAFGEMQGPSGKGS
jgi:hypothetical protein